MSEQRISDYAFLSDCHSAALVSDRGSVDWWCLPRFDSPSVFGRLLGPDAGSWSITPTDAFEVSRTYVGESLVVRTEFRTERGAVAVTDALALEPGARGHDIGLRSPHTLVRHVEGLSGAVTLGMRLCPRPEYGLKVPAFAWENRAAVMRSGPVTLRFAGTAEVTLREGCVVADIDVRGGQTHDLSLTYTPTYAEERHPLWTRALRCVTPSRRGSRGQHCIAAIKVAISSRCAAQRWSCRD